MNIIELLCFKSFWDVRTKKSYLKIIHLWFGSNFLYLSDAAFINIHVLMTFWNVHSKMSEKSLIFLCTVFQFCAFIAAVWKSVVLKLVRFLPGYLTKFMRFYVYLLNEVCCNLWLRRQGFCFVRCKDSRKTFLFCKNTIIRMKN